MHPPQQHRSNLLARTEGAHCCRETKPCLRPSSDEKTRLRILAETTDGKGGLFGNVDLQGCHAAHLKTHANAHAERFVRSIKEGCLERLILFGESSLRSAVQNFVAHYHSERNHQGLSNRLIFLNAFMSAAPAVFSVASDWAER
jgi:Integrase core domain